MKPPTGAAPQLSIEGVRSAQGRIAEYVQKTPLVSMDLDGAAGPVRCSLKAELLQPGGSFKIRGAINAVLQLSDAERASGVVSMSAGNHAIALALAAGRVGVRAVIVMPAGASETKIAITRRHGAEVVLTDEPLEQKMEQVRLEQGLTLVHPFDDPNVVLGAGTVGAELIDQADPLDAVFVPIGGGGLIGGVSLAVKSLSPSTRVFGVEPVGADAMHVALRSNGTDRPSQQQSIADGLKAPYAGAIGLDLVKRHVDEMIYVTDAEIAESFRALYSQANLACEPSGAAGLAGLMKCLGSHPEWSHVATVVSGGNVDTALVRELLAG
jgi:threonine dehydratase